jgi:flavin-binding protein dodecin
MPEWPITHPRGCKFAPMTNRTYGLTEIVGTSPEGVDAAIKNAVHRAGQTLRHLDWFEVSQIRGYIRDGEVDHVQVTMKIGYRLEDA